MNVLGQSSAPLVPLTFKNRLATWLQPALYVALAFAIYLPALPNFPRRDDHLYLSERAFHPDNWDWFFHSLSYTRTRVRYLWRDSQKVLCPGSLR